MRRKVELIVGTVLQVFAIALLNWQALGGVRTDEAKYLLNIAYPHPPLIRGFFHLMGALPFQETILRLIAATLLVQAVWVVWDMTRKLHIEHRIAICAVWLFSSAVLTQAGALLMAPFTALELLAFFWLATKPELCKRYPALIGLLWLCSLFTAYQAILFLPIVWGLARKHCEPQEAAFYVFGPVGVLALYTLSNPLALATIVLHGNQSVTPDWSARLIAVALLWVTGGAGVGTLFGTWGMLRSRDWNLIASFVLVCAYLLLSVPQPYYSILFTPFLVEGTRRLLTTKRNPHAFPLVAALIGASAVITWFVQPPTLPTPARAVMQAIRAAEKKNAVGPIVINGSFGHEWQYESRVEIRRYRPQFAAGARAVICLTTCDPPFVTSDFKLLPNLPVQTWVRK